MAKALKQLYEKYLSGQTQPVKPERIGELTLLNTLLNNR
jgi:hypothetical protein